MDTLLIMVGPIIGGLILYAIISVVVRAPGTSLNRKFVKLGNFAGMTYEQISAAVGPCNSTSATTTEDGEVVEIKQWMATGYHIALIFKDGVCIGKTHEASV